MDLIHDHATHPSLCLCFRIDGIKTMSHGISGGKEVIKFADRGLFILSKSSRKMYSLSLDKIYITVCCEDIDGRYLHPKK